MIDADIIFNQVDGKVCLWCGADAQGGDLVLAAEYVVANSSPLISCVPAAVPVLWPWLEKTDARIIARFYLPDGGGDAALESMSADINAALKHGAHGAQVFVRARDLNSFVNGMRLIRDDLFFNKTLSIGLDIGEINGNAWGDVFGAMRTVRADSMLLALTRDTGNKSDFIGRLYGMLDAYGDAWCGDLHFMTGNNIIRIEQVHRLTEKMHTDAASRERFFITL